VDGPLTGERPANVPLYAPLLLLGRSAGLDVLQLLTLSAILSESRFDREGAPVTKGPSKLFRFDGSRPLKGGSPLGSLLTKARLAPSDCRDQPDKARWAAQQYLQAVSDFEETLGLKAVVTGSRGVKCSARKALAFLLSRKTLPTAVFCRWRMSFTATADFFTNLKSALEDRARVIVSPDYTPEDEKDHVKEKGRPAPVTIDQEDLRRRAALCIENDNLTQTALAVVLAVTRRAVWGFLHGRTNFRETKARRLHRWLAARGR
jgi:hypothetical protein